MIVVDTNIIAYLWLPGPQTAAAERLLSIDAEWSAPLLWRSEFRNVLAGCLRRRLLNAGAAKLIIAEAEAHLHGREFAVPSAAVLDCVAASNCSAYDCEFVALARELDVPLVTTDRQILTAFPAVTRALRDYVKRAGP